MITLDQARTLPGKAMTGAGGEKLGTIDALYADREDGDPTFATVHSGMFGSKTHFVPLAEATLSDDTVTVPYGKDLVSSAPNIDPDAELEPAEEQRLYEHYGVGQWQGTEPDAAAGPAAAGTAGTSAGSGGTAAGGAGHDPSGPTTDSAAAGSQERLHGGTGRAEAGRARLRKYVVSQGETVPVDHQETGPVDPGRLGTEPVTSQERFAEQVREQQRDREDDDPPGGDPGSRTDVDRAG